jgi:porin
MNAGLTLHQPFPHRDGDTFALGMGYAHVSRTAANADRDANFYNGGGTIVRGGETYIEATYQYQFTPWMQIQPDAQYVFNPGAGQINPAGTGRLQNELVMGVRTNILF